MHDILLTKTNEQQQFTQECHNARVVYNVYLFQ